MGGERAETCLRLLAEAQLRNATRTGGADIAWHEVTAGVEPVRWAGDVLVAASQTTRECAARVADELQVALALRSADRGRRAAARLSWMLDQLHGGPPPGWPPGSPRQQPRRAQPMRVTPIGRTLRVDDERAPSDLHLLTLVRTPRQAVITLAMRMHWPADGSSVDLEITGAGPHHLPYQQLWAVDDEGTRYLLSLAGHGGTSWWGGVAELSPVPPPGIRWLDLVADGVCPVIRLSLHPDGPPGGRPGPHPGVSREPLTVPAGERLLARVADHIMASAWDIRGPAADPRLGEMTRVLADAGALAAGSTAPGHLAALCRELGAEGHGISAAPGAAEIPAPWASVVGQRHASGSGDHPEVFAPLGTVLPDIDGTRFALAGLSSAGGQSHLHVIASGLREQQQVDLPIQGWDLGFSWWLRDGAGRWHVATAADPETSEGGEVTFLLRLTPPLAGTPDAVEVVVTGSAARVRAIVPVRSLTEQLGHLAHEPRAGRDLPAAAGRGRDARAHGAAVPHALVGRARGRDHVPEAAGGGAGADGHGRA